MANIGVANITKILDKLELLSQQELRGATLERYIELLEENRNLRSELDRLRQPWDGNERRKGPDFRRLS